MTDIAGSTVLLDQNAEKRMPEPTVRPIHRSRPFEPCLARQPCVRRHWWETVCCGQREIYRTRGAAEYMLNVHLEAGHGGTHG